MSELGEDTSGETEPTSTEFLDIIAASEQLTARLAEAPTDEHRSAIVGIHAYLSLLEELTDLQSEDLKAVLGCRRQVGELPACELDELQVSHSFLAFASEVALATESSAEVVRSSVELAVRSFKESQRRHALVRGALTTKRSGITALQALAQGDVGLAGKLMGDYLAADWVERRTASGQAVFFERNALSDLVRLVVSDSDDALTTRLLS